MRGTNEEAKLTPTPSQELIKVRGWQVSPTEIEACLLQHPLIRDAAVIGVGYPDTQEELPRAYIVVDSKPSDNPLSDNKIHEHVGNHLAKYKSLTGGIRRIDSIPKSAAGKILKKILREASAKEAIEVESIKHVEQPIPVDKVYFEHVEHVETTDHGVHEAKENGHKIGNGNVNGLKNGANGTSENKKRKHESKEDNSTQGLGHKRTKSHPNGVAAGLESNGDGTRRSSRIIGKAA